MGAFDGELSRLGYRFERPSAPKVEIEPEVLARQAWVEQMHAAKMPCPGSCSSVCVNHWCSAHNGEPYDLEDSVRTRFRVSLGQPTPWAWASVAFSRKG